MLDIRQDPNLSQISFALKQAELPSYVEDATLDQLGIDDQNIPVNAFAATKEHSLPCHTKAACFISICYAAAQPDVDSSVRQRVDAKLAELRELHGIQEEELEPVLKVIKEAFAPQPTAAEQSIKLNNMTKQFPNQLPMADLVEAARELKTAGVDDEFTRNWSFDKPMANLPAALLAIQGNVKLSSLEGKMGEFVSLTPRQQSAQLPMILAEINKTVPTSKLHEKLARVPTKEHFDIRLGAYEFPREQVEKALPKIAFFTDVPLYSSALRLPAKDWEQVLESATEEQQRQIIESL